MTRAVVAAGVVVAALWAGGAAPVDAVPGPRPISEDTTWSAAESPVRSGSIRVEPGVTLTIEPGVRVEMSAGAVILVQGRLHAAGTAEQPIVFTGDASWDGIWILPGATGLTTIRHARLERATTAVRVQHWETAVHDTLFTHNNVGLRVENPGGDLSLSGNEFYSNGTAFSSKTTGSVGIYDSDFWDNRISMFFEAQDPYSCITDHGVYGVHENDILRGPDAEWFAYDVRTSHQSIESDMLVWASGNWWGTTDEENIEARMRLSIECCPRAPTTPVQWQDPAAVPQTEAEPPGPVGDPPPDDDPIGDVEYVVDVLRPDWGDCLPSRSVERIVGIVRPAVGEVPEEIETVALVRGTERCKSYDPEVGFVESACDEPFEFTLPVRRDDKFVLRLRRPLRPGRYTFYAGFFGRDVSKFRVLSEPT